MKSLKALIRKKCAIYRPGFLKLFSSRDHFYKFRFFCGPSVNCHVEFPNTEIFRKINFVNKTYFSNCDLLLVLWRCVITEIFSLNVNKKKNKKFFFLEIKQANRPDLVYHSLRNTDTDKI